MTNYPNLLRLKIMVKVNDHGNGHAHDHDHDNDAQNVMMMGAMLSLIMTMIS